ncbi:hypothetical protein DPEC_G00192340 [Dallia pectoralis]|uniref:Uncharacterized protein n=1 Tax=Dallia pectoralis TaxID=75939 RepID=A0ACC2GC76_DALPE|nr:hypothetical protein DPEC_G00192340 [Dallia pectoralis]
MDLFGSFRKGCDGLVPKSDDNASSLYPACPAVASLPHSQKKGQHPIWLGPSSSKSLEVVEVGV